MPAWSTAGAVGMGCMKLGIPKPQDLRKKQAVAAAGQSQLMRMYEAGQAKKALTPKGDLGMASWAIPW